MRFSQNIAQIGILAGLERELSRLPDIDVSLKSSASPGADAVLSLSEHGKVRDIAVLVRKELYPRDARELLWRLKHKQPPGLPGAWLIAAERLSEGAKALLKAERTGYFTEDGALFLCLNGLYLHVETVAKKKAPARVLRSLFTATRAKVLQALLLSPSNWFTIKELSDICAVAPATVCSVLQALERLEWVEQRGKGPAKRRRLSSSKELLDEWVSVLPAKTPFVQHSYFVPGQGSIETLEKSVLTLFSQQLIGHAVTGAAAARRYAPALPASSVLEVYVASREAQEENDASVVPVLRGLHAQEVTEGANLKLIEGPLAEHLLFARSFEGFNFANPVQVYLHLMQGGESCRALAEQIRLAL